MPRAPRVTPDPAAGLDPTDLAEIASAHLAEEVLYARAAHTAAAARAAAALACAAHTGDNLTVERLLQAWFTPAGRPGARTHVLAREVLTLAAMAASLPHRARHRPAQEFTFHPTLAPAGPDADLRAAAAQMLTAIVTGHGPSLEQGLRDHLRPSDPAAARAFLRAAADAAVAGLSVEATHTAQPVELVLAAVERRAALVA